MLQRKFVSRYKTILVLLFVVILFLEIVMPITIAKKNNQDDTDDDTKDHTKKEKKQKQFKEKHKEKKLKEPKKKSDTSIYDTIQLSDFNQDGALDILDVLLMVSLDGPAEKYDVNQDGVFDLSDMNLILENCT